MVLNFSHSFIASFLHLFMQQMQLIGGCWFAVNPLQLPLHRVIMAAVVILCSTVLYTSIYMHYLYHAQGSEGMSDL